jgi:hypothetical protein
VGFTDPSKQLFKLGKLFLFCVAVILLLGALIARQYSPMMGEYFTVFGVAVFSILIGQFVADLFGEDPAIAQFRRTLENAGISMNHAQLGVKKSYLERRDAYLDIVADIAKSKFAVEMYSGVCHSELLKPGGNRALVEALSDAIVKAHKAERDFRIVFGSLAPSDVAEVPHAKELLDLWAKREGRQSSYVDGQISRATKDFFTLVAEVEQAAMRPVTAERRYFKDFAAPHALVVIDEHIVYLSVYDWVTPTGTVAVTFRLCDGNAASRFIDEARKLKSDYSVIHRPSSNAAAT